MKNLIKDEDLDFIINELMQKDNLDEKASKIIFMYSAVTGDLEKLTHFLDKNIDVNMVDENGKTALIHAVINNHKDIIELLLKNGANINIKDKRGLTAVKYAIKNKNIEISNILTSYGAVIQIKAKSNFNLIKAAQENNYELAKIYIQSGIDVNTISSERFTALHYAAQNNNYELVELLLKSGADPNILTVSKETALMLAVNKKADLKIIKLLIDYKTDINIQDSYGRTALMNERKKGTPCIETMELLLKSGANSNLKDTKNLTPLIIAVEEEQIDKVKLLLDYKADPNIQNANGWTALHSAVAKNNIEIAKLLLEYTPTNKPILKNNPYGSDLNLGIEKNNSILKLCVEIGNLEMLELLLTHGANPNIPSLGKTSILYFTKDHPKMTQLLLEYGANPNLYDPRFILHVLIKEAIDSEKVLESLELLIGYGLTIDYNLATLKNLKRSKRVNDERKREILNLIKNAKKIRKEYLERDNLYKIEEPLNEEKNNSKTYMLRK